MKYWKSYRPEIIDDLFHKFLQKKKKLSFWQQITEDTRFKFEGYIKDIKKDICSIVLEANDQDTFDLIRKELPLYAHSSKDNILFKKEKFNLHDHFIEFLKPNEIHIYEKRAVERFEYKYQDHKSVTFSSEKSPKDPNQIHTGVVVDISTRGLGFVISNKNLNLKIGTTLYLRNVTDQEMKDPFPTKVTYLEEYNKKDKTDLVRIGIIFNEDLSEISYKSIKSIVEKKQQKIRGLRPDRYCGLTTEDQAKKLRKIAAENIQLARNIKDNVEFLDSLRYLTTQMKKEFLLAVNLAVLSTALRLSNKELIFELFSETTKTMQDEFLEHLKEEKPASAIDKAQDQIIEFVKEQERKGAFILDPLSFITYV